MSAETRVLAMLGGVVLLHLLWTANRRVAENYWLSAIEDDAGDDEDDGDTGGDGDLEGDGDGDRLTD
jgi:hypothetical protein